MFVGHYGVTFAAKARDRTAPLWVLEAGLLFGGMWLYFQDQPGRRKEMVILGSVMLGVHAIVRR